MPFSKQVEEGYFSIIPAGREYAQTDKFVSLEGTVCETSRYGAELRSRVGRAWACHKSVPQNASSSRCMIGGSFPLSLKRGLVRAEVVEKLLHVGT